MELSYGKYKVPHLGGISQASMMGASQPKSSSPGKAPRSLFSLEKKVILSRCNKYLVVGSKDSGVQQEATGTN